ncbi:MAG: biopolymer transporter ExbD [Acidobacteriota bacterium]|jgi:biopolymer transport protein TolR|nr:MAG: protein TolR [Acidobacteriota bacterium]
MAMDVGGAKGGIKSDINVTPLVDVMLVLLIIVMLVAPLIQQGVSLTLPTANSSVPKPDTDDQTTVYVDANSRLYVNAIEMTEPEVVARLREIVDSGKSQVVYLKGDVDAPYSAIMQMMDALRAAQIETVALITETTAALGGEGD